MYMSVPGRERGRFHFQAFLSPRLASFDYIRSRQLPPTKTIVGVAAYSMFVRGGNRSNTADNAYQVPIASFDAHTPLCTIFCVGVDNARALLQEALLGRRTALCGRTPRGKTLSGS